MTDSGFGHLTMDLTSRSQKYLLWKIITSKLLQQRRKTWGWLDGVKTYILLWAPLMESSIWLHLRLQISKRTQTLKWEFLNYVELIWLHPNYSNIICEKIKIKTYINIYTVFNMKFDWSIYLTLLTLLRTNIV